MFIYVYLNVISHQGGVGIDVEDIYTSCIIYVLSTKTWLKKTSFKRQAGYVASKEAS